MIEMTVSSRREFAAAVKACVGDGPTSIALAGSTFRVTFHKNLDEARAGQILRQLRQTPPSALRSVA